MLPIQVWRFEHAPEVYKRLSTHGGDEDWLALVPAEYAGDFIGWLQEGSEFGCCSVSIHHLEETGEFVYIGAHA